MAVENLKRLLAHYEDNNMEAEAANIKLKLELKGFVAEKPKATKKVEKKESNKKSE